MLALLVTLFSLVLTVVLGGIFLVGLHRVVQWAVKALESRERRMHVDERELTSH